MDGVHVVSTDGTDALVETGGGWRAASGSDPFVSQLTAAIPYLVAADTADDILVNRMRNGFVDLLDQTTEGVGDDALDRFEIAIDATAYNGSQPLQWTSFQRDVVPGAPDDGEVRLTFWLDQSDVLVRLRHPASNWSWERVSYTDQPIELPADALAAG